MVVPPAINAEPGRHERRPAGDSKAIHKQRVASVYSAFHFSRRHLDGLDDVRVSTAPAKVARRIFSNLAVRPGAAFVNTGNRRHDLTGCAITALKPVTLNEGQPEQDAILPLWPNPARKCEEVTTDVRTCQPLPVNRGQLICLFPRGRRYAAPKIDSNH
jgi:hypothetical protein